MLSREEMIDKLVENDVVNFFDGNTRWQMEFLRGVFGEYWEKSDDAELKEMCIDYNFIEEDENV